MPNVAPTHPHTENTPIFYLFFHHLLFQLEMAEKKAAEEAKKDMEEVQRLKAEKARLDKEASVAQNEKEKLKKQIEARVSFF